MGLTKTETLDKYEVAGEFKHIQCRHMVVIEEDGAEISRYYHRHIIAPGDDVAGEEQEIKDLVNLVHTQEVKDAYQAYLASLEV